MNTILDDRIIESSIIRGAKFLLDSQNPDGGIKFEDEKSIVSGIWVTAEALEFFLKSRVLPMTCYEQVRKMIDFIIASQKSNGAWSVLTNTNADSTISTGHCVYALKLSLVRGFVEKTLEERIHSSIKKGEKWLRTAVVMRSDCAFWGADNKINKRLNPNTDERSRMEYIFTSFYALMGLINPEKYPEDSLDDRDIIKKAYYFFRNQAEWFSEKYTSTTNFDKLNITDFAKIASSVGRIINVLIMINLDYPPKLMDGLKEVIEQCVKSSYMTTSITINTRKIGQTGETYNNNTPFDMGMALVNLKTDAIIIEEIINLYIDNQESEGFWFLSFSSAYTIKTWATSEALIFLEFSSQKYHAIKNAEIETHSQQIINKLNEQLAEKESQISKQRTEYEKQCKEYASEYERTNSEQTASFNARLKAVQKHSTLLAVISCALSVALGIAFVFISQTLSEANPVISNVLNALLIPLIVNIFYDIFKTIHINKNNGGE